MYQLAGISPEFPERWGLSAPRPPKGGGAGGPCVCARFRSIILMNNVCGTHTLWTHTQRIHVRYACTVAFACVLGFVPRKNNVSIKTTQQNAAVAKMPPATRVRDALARLLAAVSTAWAAHRKVRPSFPPEPPTEAEWSAALSAAKAAAAALAALTEILGEPGVAAEPLPANVRNCDSARFHGLTTFGDLGRLLRRPPTRTELVRALEELRDRLS